MDARVLLVADDLTGAAESAAAFLPRDVRIEAVEGVRESRVVRDVVVVDTDSRYLPEAEAARRCRVALARGPAGAMIVKKIDSTLRGPLAAEVTVLAAGGPVVVATASPALGRTVVGGVVHVHGVPLVRSGVWAAESRPAPESIAAALAPVRSEVVELAAVRGALRALVARLGAVLDAGAVPVCDAETTEDLDRVVRAGHATGRPVRWVGSAGLAYALARALAPTLAGFNGSRAEGWGAGAATEGSAGWASGVSGDGPAGRAGAVHSGTSGGGPAGVAATERSAGGAGAVAGEGSAGAAGGGGWPPLFVVGSASVVAREQVGRLGGVVDDVVELDPGAEPRVVADRVAGRCAVVRLPELAAGRESTTRSSAAAAELAAVAAAAAATHGALVLTGGETARAVLTALGIAELRVVAAWDDGAVVSVTPDGRTVVTKPGAFGGPDALLRIARRLGIQHQEPEEENR